MRLNQTRRVSAGLVKRSTTTTRSQCAGALLVLIVICVQIFLATLPGKHYQNSTNGYNIYVQPLKERDASDIETFLDWAKELAVNKEVLLAYASKDYKVLAHNCILSLHAHGVKNTGILTLDDETVEFFRTRNIAAYNVAKITKGIPQDIMLNTTLAPRNDIYPTRLTHPDWSTRWTSPSTIRWSHWLLRHYLALRVLKEGYGVYQTDVDTVFVNNPYDWLDPEADLEGQIQNWPKKGALNLGIGHIAATHGGVLHWETANNLMRHLGDDPQSIDNFLLIDPLMKQVGSTHRKPCHKDFPDILCVLNKTPTVSYRLWAETTLPMGYSTDWKYPAKGDASKFPLIGIHVHATTSDYETGKEKLYTDYCKERGIWYIPAEE